MMSSLTKKLKKYIYEGFNEVNSKKMIRVSNQFSLICAEGPYIDFISYCTLGLSDLTLEGGRGPVDFGVEILSGAPPAIVNYDRVLEIMLDFFFDEKQLLTPGNVLQDAVLVADIGCNHLPHLYFSMPNYWGDHFINTQIDNREIKFLAVFAISEKEYSFLKDYGSDEFEDLFITKEVDIFNPMRESVW